MYYRTSRRQWENEDDDGPGFWVYAVSLAIVILLMFALLATVSGLRARYIEHCSSLLVPLDRVCAGTR